MTEPAAPPDPSEPSFLTRLKEKVVRGNGTKALLERSGMRAFLGTLLFVVGTAWATDMNIVQEIKDNHETLLPLLLLALGLSASTSKK